MKIRVSVRIEERERLEDPTILAFWVWRGDWEKRIWRVRMEEGLWRVREERGNDRW